MGKVKIELPTTINRIFNSVGIYHLNVEMDTTIGNEVVLVIYDPTEFIYELKSISPFQFHSGGVAINTVFGPIFSFLFWVSDPNDLDKPFAIMDKPIDISNLSLIEPWVKIANQTHLHLLLVDQKYKVIEYYEFENQFEFENSVEFIKQISPERLIDYNNAEREYFNRYSLNQLYSLAKGK